MGALLLAYERSTRMSTTHGTTIRNIQHKNNNLLEKTLNTPPEARRLITKVYIGGALVA